MIIATAELFESLTGQEITVTTATGTEPWLVQSVTRRDPHAFRVDQPFNVYLRAPAARSAPQQGSCSSVLPGGEVLEFFAVPIAASKEAVSYEVIFN